MSHDSTNAITCPHCDHVFADSWEYGDNATVECVGCGKQFLLTIEHHVTYTTKRPDCEDDAHKYGPAQRFLYSQSTLNRWIAEGGCMARIALQSGGPHALWVRACQVCDHKHYSGNVPIDAPNPFEQAPAAAS